MYSSVTGSPRSGTIVTASGPTSTDAGTASPETPSTTTLSCPRYAMCERTPRRPLGLRQQVVAALGAELRSPLGLGAALGAHDRDRQLLPAVLAELAADGRLGA